MLGSQRPSGQNAGVDVDEARAILGVGASDDWGVVRTAYRNLIREAHPDLAGPSRTRQAARLNEAYVVLTRERRQRRSGGGKAAGTKAPKPAPRPAAPPRPSGRPGGARGAAWGPISSVADGMEQVDLPMSPAQAVVCLVAAGHAVGEVSYVDRSSGVVEVIVQHEGESCSLLAMVESDADGSARVLFALEALQRVASPPPGDVVRRLLAFLPGS